MVVGWVEFSYCARTLGRVGFCAVGWLMWRCDGLCLMRRICDVRMFAREVRCLLDAL